MRTRGAHHLHILLQVLELLCRCGSEVGKATPPATGAKKKCASRIPCCKNCGTLQSTKGGNEKILLSSTCLCPRNKAKQNWKLYKSSSNGDSDLIPLTNYKWIATNSLIHFNAADVWFKSEHQVPEPTFFLRQILQCSLARVCWTYSLSVRSQGRIQYSKSRFKIHLNYLSWTNFHPLPTPPKATAENKSPTFTTIRPQHPVLTHVTTWKASVSEYRPPNEIQKGTEEPPFWVPKNVDNIWKLRNSISVS